MEKPKLAVIIPCYNEESCIEDTVKKLFIVINDLIAKNKIKDDSFIYLVDDGSQDSTWMIIQKLHNENNLVKGLKFIRNYGNQKALIAGLENAGKLGCDCVISIDADLQQDEKTIENFIDEYSKGADIVFGVRNDRKTDSFLKKFTAVMFYKTMNLLGVNLKVNHSDYRLVSKKVLEILKLYPEKLLFLRSFFQELGMKSSVVNFDVRPRMSGKSKYRYRTLIAMALDGITSYSIVPLRMVAVLGFLMAFFGFLIGIETVIEKIVWNTSPNGWATFIILMSVFGGIQLLCLGIIGEYIGQLYKEVKARPKYIKDVELI